MDEEVYAALAGAFLVRMAKQPNAAMEALWQASKGLMMPSETDAPFEVIRLEGEPTPDVLRKLARVRKNATVEETTLDNLFLIVPSEDKAKFQKLRQAIESQLSGVKVYKVGDQAERQVFIVGKAGDGQWAGLRTAVVET
jgi:hypothetical protein